MGSVYAHTLQTTVSAFGLILCHLPARSHQSCTKPDQLDSGFNDAMMKLSSVVFLDMQLITVFFSWVRNFFMMLCMYQDYKRLSSPWGFWIRKVVPQKSQTGL